MSMYQLKDIGLVSFRPKRLKSDIAKMAHQPGQIEAQQVV